VGVAGEVVEGGAVGAVGEAGKAAFDKAEEGRVDVLGLAKLHPSLPMIAAQALLIAMNETFKAAYDLQIQQSLEHWLAYQAQSRLGAKGTADSPQTGDAKTTDLSSLTTSTGDWPGKYRASSSSRPTSTTPSARSRDRRCRSCRRRGRRI
jgi:hypothetical protein